MKRLLSLVLRFLILWITAVALVITIYGYGQNLYYRYANRQGLGYELKTWKGTSLDNDTDYPKGYTYRDTIYRFERNPEIRTIAIILILAVAGFLTVQMFTRPVRNRPENPIEKTSQGTPPGSGCGGP